MINEILLYRLCNFPPWINTNLTPCLKLFPLVLVRRSISKLGSTSTFPQFYCSLLNWCQNEGLDLLFGDHFYVKLVHSMFIRLIFLNLMLYTLETILTCFYKVILTCLCLNAFDILELDLHLNNLVLWSCLVIQTLITP